jgi:hypothetical protein
MSLDGKKMSKAPLKADDLQVVSAHPALVRELCVHVPVCDV